MINPDHSLFTHETEAELGTNPRPVPGQDDARNEQLRDDWARRFDAGENPDPFALGSPWG